MHTRASRNEPALTGLEMVILLVLVAAMAGYIGYGVMFPDTPDTRNRGMIKNEIVATSSLLTSTGGTFGFPAIDGPIDGVPVRFRTQNPRALGAYEITVQPFMITAGAIDMGHATIIWSSGNDLERLALVQTPVLVCPNWTITHKANFIPLKGADEDLLLENSEQFTLLICPSANAAPYQKFSLTIAPVNGEILPLAYLVPPKITSVTTIG